MQAATLDAEATLRAEFRTVLRDLRYYGVPVWMIRGKNLAELWELRTAVARRLMTAPNCAA